MKSIPLIVALVAIGAALTACTPERTLDGALGATSGMVDLWFQRHLQSRRSVVARLVAVAAGSALKLGLVAGGVVGATAGPAIASSWGIRGGRHHRRHRRHY